MGYRAASGRPSRPRHSRPRSDRDRDLSARQRQGRRLCAAPCAIALVREIAEAGRIDAGDGALIQPESAAKGALLTMRYLLCGAGFQYASILLASLLVCTRLRLFSILPSISAKSLRSRAERHDRMTCSL